MEQTLHDYIKENENLRKVLLAQDGGIMKYWAEHLDTNGTAALFNDYQEHCAKIFFEKNKWDLRMIWGGDEMKRAALGEMEHLWKELKYQRTLKPVLAELSVDVTELFNDFIEQYLTYAYKQNRLRWHPNGITNIDVYHEVIEMYNSTGMAYKCMRFILREHHSNGKIEKTESDLFTEFLIRMRSKQLTLGVFAQMRHAVADMLIGKTVEQCRQMAIDTMEHVRGFSQMIYTDEVVKNLREIEITEEADGRERDGVWLREVAQRGIIEAFSDHVKTHSLGYYFSNFVNLLKDVGRIWAAQLLVRGIDMHELEKEVYSILNPDDNLHYYVDKYYTNDLPNKYCVSNSDVAKKLLKKMGRFTDEGPGGSWDGSLDSVFDPRINPHKIFLELQNENRPMFRSPYARFFVFYKVLVYLHWVKGTQTEFLKWVNLHWNCGWIEKGHFKFSNYIPEELRKAPLHEWYQNIVKDSDIGLEYRLLAERLFILFADTTHEEERCWLQEKTYFYKKDVIDYINKDNLKHPYPTTV